MKPMRRAPAPWSVLPLLALLAAACGGGSSPSSPSTPAPPTPSPAGPAPVPIARDGLTGAAVAASITPAAPALGAGITATAAGFLTREQVFERAEIFLWPGEPDYVHDTAYWEFTDGSFRLVRWNSGFTVTLEGELGSDPVLVRKAQEVAAEASRHIGYPVSVGPGGQVTITVDPALDDENAVAQASLRTTGAVITGAVITFRRRSEIAGGPQAQYSNTLLHEMGHVIGLGHSPDDKEVMTPGEGRGTREATYQPGEAGCLRMIYAHRRAGNRFPDRDPALAATVGRLRNPVVVD